MADLGGEHCLCYDNSLVWLSKSGWTDLSKVEGFYGFRTFFPPVVGRAAGESVSMVYFGRRPPTTQFLPIRAFYLPLI